jgi:hypothetical protein
MVGVTSSEARMMVAGGGVKKSESSLQATMSEVARPRRISPNIALPKIEPLDRGCNVPWIMISPSQDACQRTAQAVPARRI